MKRPLELLPRRTGTVEVSPRALLPVTAPEARAGQGLAAADPGPSARTPRLHPRAFLETLLPPDYYLG